MKSTIKRLWQHWLHPRARVERLFPNTDLQAIAAQIAQSEQRHLGQIRFVIEARLSTTDIVAKTAPRARAQQWFSELGVWDTEHNSGVLVYINFADHAVEIITDRGIARRVDEATWQAVCQTLREAFRQEQYLSGLNTALQQVDSILQQHFARENGDMAQDELSNDVVLA
ncbi:TPM domain-containing protein [Neisseriaceae bacterium B1]